MRGGLEVTGEVVVLERRGDVDEGAQDSRQNGNLPPAPT
jgi:hypothetical protein